MAPKIELSCCEGDPSRTCYQKLCPIYRATQAKLTRLTPWTPTGYGNLYTDPDDKEIKIQVKKDLAK